MEITILRLGHRLPRDERISTHVALVARAFGASSFVYSGQIDHGLEESIERICESWGGSVNGSLFSVCYEKNPLSVIKKFKKSGFVILHLTMYGVSITSALEKIKISKEKEKLLIIVGSEKVPGEVYQLADYNISITNQPHSEVAALAIALDRIQEGKELSEKGFDFKGKIKIVPTEKGKKIVENQS
ncbi:tRNA (cytidine(56)-2'-O)-methyltransferase [Candidatus Micrarchaeota archaeon]|nr:tRNA (cytidine(56)-2'-O)-methyltransferase [Candidatus Micrarchaeota archaeon]